MLDAPAAIRPAIDGETRVAVELLRRAGFGGTVGRLLEWPRQSPAGTLLLAEGRHGPVGCAACASFGATGWIGALAVTPAARRRGLGAALTEACCAWLQERGAETVMLYATEMGRPVYERLGFEASAQAVAWRGSAGTAPVVPLRHLTEDDRDALKAIDAATTGEDRDAVLREIHPLHGVVVDDGEIRGWAVPSTWGTGAAICALDEDAGLALMAAATRGAGTGTLVVPEANAAAARAVRDWGFMRLNDAVRMHLGPSPAWHAERQFGLFNLFWG